MVMESFINNGIRHHQLCMLPVDAKPLTALPPMHTLHLGGFHLVTPPMRMPLPL